MSVESRRPTNASPASGASVVATSNEDCIAAIGLRGRTGGIAHAVRRGLRGSGGVAGPLREVPAIALPSALSFLRLAAIAARHRNGRMHRDRARDGWVWSMYYALAVRRSPAEILNTIRI